MPPTLPRRNRTGRAALIRHAAGGRRDAIAATARGLMECQVMTRTRLRRLVQAGALAAAAAGLAGCYAYPVGYAGYSTYGYDSYAYAPAPTYSAPRYYSYPRAYSYPQAYSYPRAYGYPNYYRAPRYSG